MPAFIYHSIGNLKLILPAKFYQNPLVQSEDIAETIIAGRHGVRRCFADEKQIGRNPRWRIWACAVAKTPGTRVNRGRKTIKVRESLFSQGIHAKNPRFFL